MGSHWQGWQKAQFSLLTLPVAPTQSSLPAVGRAVENMPGALGLSVSGEAGMFQLYPGLPVPLLLSQFPFAPQPGDSVMVVPTLPDEEAKKLFPKGVFTKDLPSGKKYLRYTPQPE